MICSHFIFINRLYRCYWTQCFAL